MNRDILQIVIFIDSFFVNNRNLSFQIDYVVCLIDAIDKINILHWSFVKCKRMIRNIFVFELYVMIHEFDIAAMLKATLKKMLQFDILLMICIDSKSFYDCFVKLKIIQKKRLMIDVMSFRQLYKRRKIIEMKWIQNINNSIDSITKTKTSSIFKILIDSNRINFIIIEWIERGIEIEDKKKWNMSIFMYVKKHLKMKLILKKNFRSYRTLIEKNQFRCDQMKKQ